MSNLEVPRAPLLPAALAVALLAGAAQANLQHQWIARVPVGSALGAGPQGMVVDGAGVSFITGTGGSSGNTDIVTTAFAPDGTQLWSRTFDGPVSWHDQARGIALGPGGTVWVTGNTPAASKHANVLVLGYDAATGALVRTIQYSSGAGIAEHGASIALDAAGNVYVGGGTVGDGGDGLMLKFDPGGQLAWKQTWDGAAWGPYSQDHVLQVQLDPTGQPVFLIHGVMASLHPDFVVVELSSVDGSTSWEAAWGVSGEDWPIDMALDAAGDVYVTGMGLSFTNQYSTIKLRGTDGQLLWQAYDKAGIDDVARAIALDGKGGVYITGAVDPDGDQSNFNDDIYTVKRDATTGALLWTHRYGDPCKGCFDSPSDLIVDAGGNVFVAGSTSSAPYSGDVITLVLQAGTGVEIDRGIVSGGFGQGAGTGVLRFDAAFNLYNGGRTYNANTGQVEMTVFRYDALAGDPGPSVYCTARTTSCGSTPTLSGPSAWASLSAGAGSYDVACGPVPTGANPGLVLYTTRGPAANPVGSPFGFLCIATGPGLFRIPQATLPQGSGCAASYTFDFGQHLATQTVDPNLVAGATVDLQLWYRDPASTNGANLSDAMGFTLVP